MSRLKCKKCCVDWHMINLPRPFIHQFYMSGSRGGGDWGSWVSLPSPLESHKAEGFLINTGPDPIGKSQSYQASLQGWPTSERVLKWCFAGGLMMARYWCSLYPLSPHQLKIGPPLTKLFESGHVLCWSCQLLKINLWNIIDSFHLPAQQLFLLKWTTGSVESEMTKKCLRTHFVQC